MKIYHFTIIFAIFSLGIYVITDTAFATKTYADKERILMDWYLDDAVNSAAWELRAAGMLYDDEMAERAINTFFYSMYGSLGIMDLPAKKMKLTDHFPMFIISLGNEYYVYRRGFTDNENEEALNYYISEKVEYADDEEHPVSFAAYLTDYPFEYGVYDAYRVSASTVKNRNYSGENYNEDEKDH